MGQVSRGVGGTGARETLRRTAPGPMFPMFFGTMAINAPVISGLDPGAVPGGSTNNPALRVEGPKQDRRTSKGVSFRPVRYHRYRSEKYSCQRQPCSGGRCRVSGNQTET